MREQRVKRTKTVCTYCGVGCSFDIWTKDRHILKVEPAEGPANGISTCVKGKFGWDYVNAEDRLTKPLIREGGTFREATWKEALELIANKFSAIKNEHGPDAIGLIASSKCTNEESYLMQKLARAVIGTNNIDNCSRYCQTPATMGLSRTVGYGGDTGSIRDIEAAGLVLIVGSNTAESHPVLATRVKQSHKLRGQRLIVADLREHEMARRADILLHPKPSTELVWLSAVVEIHYRQWAGEDGLCRSLGQRFRGVSRQPGSVHIGICGASDRNSGGHVAAGGAGNRTGGQRLHSVGHGRHATLWWLRHVDVDFKPAAGHRELHEAGRRRLSVARPQQCARRERLRFDAKFRLRLSEGGRSGGDRPF